MRARVHMKRESEDDVANEVSGIEGMKGVESEREQRTERERERENQRRRSPASQATGELNPYRIVRWWPGEGFQRFLQGSLNKMAGKRKGTSKKAVGGWQMKKHKVERKDIRDWAGKGKRTPRTAVGGWQGKKQEILERKDVRDWSGLRDYVLEDVIRRLPLSDSLSFASVCKPWQSVASKYLGGCDRRVPCFVKRGENEATVRSGFNFLSNSNFKMDLPQAHGRMIFGSFQDWLFLGRCENINLDLSLLNPFSGENIKLPETLADNYLLVLSADPSDKNCVFMVAALNDLSFWTPGARKWLTIDIKHSYEYLDALHYSGCFYILDSNDQVVVIKVDNVINTDIDATVPYQTFSLKLPRSPNSEYSRHYLVESRGDILLVSRFFSANNAGVTVTCAFETYKLDLHKIAWLKLENLEDRILFVGSGCSRSFHAKDLGHALANNVYFINDAHCVYMNEWDRYYTRNLSHKNDNDWGVFFSEKPNHWPSAFRAKAKRWAGVWLTTPLSWCLKHSHR